jgi:hypothetical protein
MKVKYRTIPFRWLSILFLFSLLLPNCTDDLCEEPDFEHPKGVIFRVDGKMIVNNPNGENIAFLYTGQHFRVKFWKKYCHGEVENVFEYNYLTDFEGNLVKQSYESAEFTVQNPLDVIEYVVYYVAADGSELNLGEGDTRYYQWEPSIFNYFADGNLVIVYLSDGSGNINWAAGAMSMSFE